jgi:hypothetical protein
VVPIPRQRLFLPDLPFRPSSRLTPWRTGHPS